MGLFRTILCGSVLSVSSLCAGTLSIDPTPVSTIVNPNEHYTLINSIDFHPKENLFCVTYTQEHRIDLYTIDNSGKTTWVQSLNNPLAKLEQPQHAVFSPDGKRMIVANWTSEAVTFYQRQQDGLFSQKPIAVIPPKELFLYKPHGIAVSPSGKFLAIAYGYTNRYKHAIAIFKFKESGTQYNLISLLMGNELPGIPKGITFSPDESCLLVTFSNKNSLNLYDLSPEGIINPTCRQGIEGQNTKISRPEDVKLSPNGDWCALSNSNQNCVTFYPYDKTTNYITQITPAFTLQNPAAGLSFPHGMAFSPDGAFFLVSNFGPVKSSSVGDVEWDHSLLPDQAKIHIYKVRK